MPSKATIFKNAKQWNSEVSRPELTGAISTKIFNTAYPNSEFQKTAIENGCAKALQEVNEKGKIQCSEGTIQRKWKTLQDTISK